MAEERMQPHQLMLLVNALGDMGGQLTCALNYPLPLVKDFADRTEALIGELDKGRTGGLTHAEVRQLLHRVFQFYTTELERAATVPHANPHVMSPEQIRTAVYERSELHERQGCANSPAGQPCWHDRTNMIAYLCHTLGVRGDRLLKDVASLIGDYDKTCREKRCKHSDN